MSNLRDIPALRPPGDRLRIVVLGRIVRRPLAGPAWHHLQYVLGLAKLGHDVVFAEDGEDGSSCYDPVRDLTHTDPRYGLVFVNRVFRRMGLGERWAYFDAGGGGWLGPAAARMGVLWRTADLLIDLSGGNALRAPMREIAVRVLVDTDPVFTQLRHVRDPAAACRARAFTKWFSFGENIGAAGCTIPDDGLPWKVTRQPIVLGAWPVLPPRAERPFTTVVSWDSHDCREREGPSHDVEMLESFAPYLDLPARTGEILELAVGSVAAGRDLLRARGWRLRDVLEIARNAWSYQSYLQHSKGEFTVAAQANVASRSGGISGRSAAYLVSGRPVVAQETGFSAHLPTGAGLLAFDTPDAALAGIGEVAARHPFHCRAAREVAESCFDSGRVLTRLLEDTFSTAAPCAVAPATPAGE